MIHRNGAVRIDEKTLETAVDDVINYIINIRKHLLSGIAREYARLGAKFVDLKQQKYTEKYVKNLSIKQALKIVKYGEKEVDFDTREEIDTGIIIPIEMPLHGREKPVTFNVKIWLRPVQYRSYGNLKRVFESGGYASTPLLHRKTRIKELQQTPSAKILIKVAAGLKISEIEDQVKYHIKTTRQQIRALLAHELAHVIDPQISAGDYPKRDIESYTEKDWPIYYNSPTEIRARIVEFSKYAGDYDTFDDFLNQYVKSQHSWKYFTENTKKIILSGLYSEWHKPKPLKQHHKAIRYLSAALGGLAIKDELTDIEIPKTEKRKYTKKEAKPSERRFKIESYKGWIGPYTPKQVAEYVANHHGHRKAYIEIRSEQIWDDSVKYCWSDWDGDFSVYDGPSTKSIAKIAKLLETIKWTVESKHEIEIHDEEREQVSDYIDVKRVG